ncbi:MAG TPA: S1 RNA-binding domain-containing protein, partial [candidate division Zixibacteria bacterium]|nr:S1 RNA-binding domain-containing protein [candidate division Zixibacteria bacterium]
MTENNLIEKNTEMSMGQLLKEYSYERPKRGDFIDAEVMQIDDNHILLDLGAKTDAIITPNELKKTDEKILDTLSEGDIVPVYV